MLPYLTVTVLMSSWETENPNFVGLKNYLHAQGIFLNTTVKEAFPESAESAKVTIIAYSEQTTKLEVKEEDPELNELAAIFNKPPYRRIVIVGPNVLASELYTDGLAIVVKLSAQTQEFKLDFPHYFFDISSGLNAEGVKIAAVVRSAGIRDLTERSNRPNDEALSQRFLSAKLDSEEFPVLGDGTKILPGTKIYGGKGFFYDANGYILDARRIADTGRLDDDWVFLCGFEAFEYNGWKEVEGKYEWFNIYDLATSLIADLLPPQKLLTGVKPLLRAVDREVMEYCARYPNGLDHLTPESFEDLMAAIYRNSGFDVEKIGRWNQGDGGVDILAIRKDLDLGEYKVAIQCKHSKNTIRPGVIRELNGTIDQFKANAGVVATTSFFSPQSHELVENTIWRINLQDRSKIIKRLQAIFNL